MTPFVFRFVWSKRKLFLASFLLNLTPKKHLIYNCDERFEKEKMRAKLIPSNQFLNERSSLMEIIQMLRRHLLLTLSATGTAVLAAVMSILSPIYISKIIDEITTGLSTNLASSNLAGSAGMLLGVSLANAVLTALYIRLIGILGESIAGEIKIELFTKLLHESMTFFDDHEIGELLTRLTVDVQNFKHSLKQILTTGIKSSVQLTASVVQMALLSSSLTLNLSLSLPVILYIGIGYGKYLRSLSGIVRDSEAKTANRAHDALINIRTVKAFVAEDFECDKYKSCIEEQNIQQQSLFGHLGIFQGLTIFSMNSLLAAVLYLGGTEVLSGKLSGGGLLAYLMSVQTAQKALTQFVTLNAKWHAMISDHERISRTVKSKEELENLHDGKIPDLPCKGKLELRDLSFSHKDRNGIFKNANLIINENEVVGIVGESGSGKSTIVSLLGKLYDPQNGTLTIDGVDIRKLDLKWIRKQFGIVPQEPVLFNGTISENIAYGCAENQAEDIIQAAKRAHIHDFIESLPEGYETQLKKCSLSGGQKQRIAIARALFLSPKILIFDEATSALDNKSESVIHETLKEIVSEGKTTVIIITHNKGILDLADRVYILKDGNFVQIK